MTMPPNDKQREATPRTDEEFDGWGRMTNGYPGTPPHQLVRADFARQLERELTLANEAFETLTNTVFKLEAELTEAKSARSASESINNDLTRAIDRMHDAVLDTEASSRPAGNLFDAWWALKAMIERAAPSSERPSFKGHPYLSLISRLHDWCNQDLTGKDVIEDAQGLMTEAAEALRDAPRSATPPSIDAARLKWLEDNHTLHKSVEILYIVDGYQVTLMHEDGVTALSPCFEGFDLASAIDVAMQATADSGADR